MSDHDTAPPRRSRRSWLLSLLIFAAGLVCGASLTVVVIANRVTHALQHPGQAVARVEQLMDRRLKLDEAQRAEVERIVAEAQRKAQALRSAFQPEMEQVLIDASNQIRSVLRPEQLPAFEQFVARARSLRPKLPAGVVGR